MLELYREHVIISATRPINSTYDHAGIGLGNIDSSYVNRRTDEAVDPRSGKPFVIESWFFNADSPNQGGVPALHIREAIRLARVYEALEIKSFVQIDFISPKLREAIA